MTASRPCATGPQLARLVALLMASTMLYGVPRALAQTLPTGGSVAAGSVSIGTPTGGSLTVTQSSSSAVVNWQSFSVGQGNTVNFVQPSSTSAILNRVTGSATSTIAGQINANGQVYLVNPNGIAITSTGSVNAASFVASTLGISDSDFMSGKRTFSGNGASASVSNAGSISIGRGGYAALLGGAVDNAGTITVPLGRVGLGSGERATLDLSGDGFLQVAMPTRAAGTGALIRNSGRITANGGTVQLSAAAARDMARQAINMSGTIEARSVGGRNGAIILGGSDGAVAVSGKLNVASRKAKGGSIAVTGRDIKLAGATLDASGKTGGGSINIGGGRQGTGTLQHAETTSVDSASTIKANATQSGNGGNVVVWSDLLTTFAGQISARGGALSGNGGEAEVSGKAKLAYTGFTDLSAANGSFGTLLLDPYNVTISSGIDSNQSGFTATGNDSVINVGTLQTQLAGANVAVSTGSGGSQAGNITVASPLTWSANTTLTLDAYRSVTINAAVTASGTTAGLTILTNHGGSGGLLTVLAPVTMPATGAVTINSTAYTLINNATDLQAIGATGAYALVGGINLSSTTGFTPLQSAGFGGTLEGFGNTISGLTITSSTKPNVGLFGLIGTSGRVQNLIMTGAAVSQGAPVGSTVTATGSGGVGILAGENDGTIYNVATAGTVTANANNQGSGLIPSVAGGLVGFNIGGIAGGIIDHSSSSATVSGIKIAAPFGIAAGGLVGNNSGGTISNSFATGTVTGGASTTGNIINGGGSAGGLVGTNADRSIGSGVDTVTYRASIINSYATGQVTGGAGAKGLLLDVGGYAGGLVGQNAGMISGSYATGTVTGGYNSSRTGGYAGGLVGYNTDTITNSYATGAATGGGSVKNGSGGNAGGLVGYNGSVISNSYSTGAATGGLGGNSIGPSGGLVGGSNVGVDVVANYISGNYWDVTTSGKTTDIYTVGVTGLTTTQWLTRGPGVPGSTSGWDVSAVWLQGYPYPVLRALPYIIVTAGASGTYGGSLTINPGVTAADQTGANALSLLNIAGMTLIGGSTAAAGTQTGLGGAGVLVTAPSPYQIAYAPISATVNPLAIAVAANALSKTYGDVNPTLTWTATGLINNDTLTGALTTTAGQYSNVGAYAITQGTLANANYAITYTGANLTVNTRDIAVAANALSKTYGDVNPTLTWAATGLVNNDTLTGALTTTAGQYSNVGAYAITQGTLANANYAITYTGANLTVNTRDIAVAANALSKTYGDVNPTLTWAATGLVNNDTLTGALTTTAGQYSNVGAYAITQGTLANANYAITYTGANLTVNTRDIAVAANALSKTYGDVNPTLTWAATGLVNNDTLTGELATDADRGSTVGRYAITQGSLLASANYVMTFVPGTLTVAPFGNPQATDSASMVVNAARFGAMVTAGVIFSPPSGTDSGSTILFADPRFDGIVVCTTFECIVASTELQP